MKLHFLPSKIAKNAAMLTILNFTKIIFPFVTLPYLTRVLSTDYYGMVSYVKAVMSYMQTLVDFGFILSATKHVTEWRDDKERLGTIVGDNIAAKGLIASFGVAVLFFASMFLPILKAHLLFTFLNYITIILSIFLLDFFFRGIEKMEVITYRFLVMKSISTVFTFILVKGDADILWIPVLDIAGSAVAVMLIFVELKKEGITIHFTGLKQCLKYMKESAIYFASNVASVSFNFFNTIVMGVFLSNTEIAYWSISIQIISASQALMTPISDAIYPQMIRTKSRALLYKVLKLFIPFISIGCLLAFWLAPAGMYLVGGAKYLSAVKVFRMLIPVIFFGFFSVIFGWPALGAIGKIKETTKTTVIAVLFQIAAIIILAAMEHFTLYRVAIIRCLTEVILFFLRYRYYCIYKYEFH